MTADSPGPGSGSRFRSLESDALQTRRIAVFLAVTFAVSWATAGVVYWLGGLSGGPELLPGVPLWLVLLAGPYMWGPTVGHLAARLVTGEGFDRREMLLTVPRRPRVWAAGWLGPVVLIAAGGVLYFLLFPGRFGGMAAVADLLAALEDQTGVELPFTPTTFLLVQLVQVILLAPVLNSLATFGEEFGWRAYLLPKLAPLGWWPALLASGVVWGVWHWPVVAMGYNYGLEYPGAPWPGLLVMVVATVGMGVGFGWLTIRSDSVGPATVAHAMVNGGAALATLFATSVPNPLLSPTPVGLVGIIPWFAVAVALSVRPDWLLPWRQGEGSETSSPSLGS